MPGALSGKDDERLKSLGFSKREREVFRTIARLPLGSRQAGAQVHGKSPANFNEPLAALAEMRGDSGDEEGLLESHVMGATRTRVPVFWLGERARALVPQYSRSWHEEFPRSQILERYPLVEQFYPAIAELKEHLGDVRDVRWSQSQSHDLICRYEKGWVAFFYSGGVETAAHLMERFNTFHEELTDTFTVRSPIGDAGLSPYESLYTSVSRRRALPSLAVIVVLDKWQVVLARRAVRERLGAIPVQIRCIATGETFGDTAPGPSKDDVLQPIRGGDMGGWPWRERLRQSLWADNHVAHAFDLLNLGVQWAGMTPKFARQLLGLASKSQEASRSLRLLKERGFMGATGSGPGLRYRVNDRGLDVLLKVEGLGFGHIHGRVRPLLKSKELSVHDAELMVHVGSLAALGAHVAAGHRELMEWGRGAIYPDAMVYVRSPYGDSWHYFEYERSARRGFAAKRKLNGYMSPRRRNTWPVMMALWDDEAEAIFHRIGAGAGLCLLTTTIERLQTMPIEDCWSMYGIKVKLESPEIPWMRAGDSPTPEFPS